MTYNALELDAIRLVEEFYQSKWTPEFTKDIVGQLKNKLKKYQQDCGLKSYVLGMSGGLDSAIVAALAADLNTKAMFIGINSSEEHRRLAELVAKQYGIDYSEKFITLSQVANFKVILLSTEDDKVAAGNLKARLRMIALYDLAKKHQGCVLSTDNLSELHMGFWTLHGDVGDIAPIQFFNKGFELQYIARELGIPEEVIVQAPSDGLGVTDANTDEAQLGGNYRYVDTVMFAYFRSECENLDDEFKEHEIMKKLLETERAQKVIKRFLNTAFKRVGTAPIFWLRNPAFLEYSAWQYVFGEAVDNNRAS